MTHSCGGMRGSSRGLRGTRPLVRVPIASPMLLALDAAMAPYAAVRRYAVAGNLALVAWRDSLDTLSDLLCGMNLKGQVLLGPPGRRFIGAVSPNAFEDRLTPGHGPGREVQLMLERIVQSGLRILHYGCSGSPCNTTFH